MVQFVSLLYVPAWLSAPLAADAPGNDLQLYQDLVRYRAIDKDVAQAALNVMRRHTAYLRPETVVFSLASDAVSEEDKASKAAALLAKEVSEDDAPLVIDSCTSLCHLVDGSRSWLVFSLLDMVASRWLRKAANEWAKDEDYLTFCAFVQAMKIR